MIVGYSFHASMAFEIAHQLLDKGSQVDLVMLLDAPAEYLLPHKIAWKNLQDTWMQGKNERVASIASRFAISLSIVRWTLAVAGTIPQAPICRERVARSGRTDHEARYAGPPDALAADRIGSTTIRCAHTSCGRLDCRGVLFRADRSEDCPAANVDYSLGWADLFGKGLEIIQVSGDHFTMMREHPHDQNLAREMSAALDRHCAKPQRATESPAIAVS